MPIKAFNPSLFTLFLSQIFKKHQNKSAKYNTTVFLLRILLSRGGILRKKIAKALLNRNAYKIENKKPEKRRKQVAYCPMRTGVKIPSLISVDILV